VSDYPEHEKLTAIVEQSQAVGEFLAWCAEEKGYALAVWEPRQRRDSKGRFSHNRVEQRMHPVATPTRRLLSEFFQIDDAKIDAEKRAMLQAMCEANRD
jgi:hypothetical protein